MKSSTLRACLLTGALLATGGEPAADEPRYGVCRQQIVDYVEQRLGQTIERIQINSYTERATVNDPGEALVFVKECNGFQAFQIFGTESVCEHIPHYGSGGSFVRYEGAYGACKRTP